MMNPRKRLFEWLLTRILRRASIRLNKVQPSKIHLTSSSLIVELPHGESLAIDWQWELPPWRELLPAIFAEISGKLEDDKRIANAFRGIDKDIMGVML